MSNWKKNSTTSERLKAAMALRHMKQADLARATGLAKGGISNYVTGRYEPKSDVISKLAKALNCSEMWLWGYDVPMERVSSQNNSPADELKLTEEEQVFLEAFRKLPDVQKQGLMDLILNYDNNRK